MGLFDWFGTSARGQERREEKARIRDKNRAEEQAALYEGVSWPVPPRLNPVNVAGEAEQTVLDPIDAERKDEIGPLIFQPHLNPDSIRFLPLEELLFVITAQDAFQKTRPLDNYEENHRILHNELLSRVRQAPVLYVLYDLSTGYPFLDHGFVNLYADKELADAAVKAFAVQFRNLTVRKWRGESERTQPERQGLFDYLYFLGMEHLLISNGSYRGRIRRSEIAAPPNVRSDKKVMAAPALCHAMCDFLGEARWNVKYEKRAEVLREKEERMLQLIAKTTYIVPIQHEGPAEVVGDNKIRFNSETKIRFFILKDRNGRMFLPVFTDVNEYIKKFGNNEWEGAAFHFTQIKSFLDGRDGLVINPFGENIMLHKDKIEELEALTQA